MWEDIYLLSFIFFILFLQNHNVKDNINLSLSRKDRKKKIWHHLKKKKSGVDFF